MERAAAAALRALEAEDLAAQEQVAEAQQNEMANWPRRRLSRSASSSVERCLALMRLDTALLEAANQDAPPSFRSNLCIPISRSLTSNWAKDVASKGFISAPPSVLEGVSITWHVPEVAVEPAPRSDLGLPRRPLYISADGDGSSSPTPRSSFTARSGLPSPSAHNTLDSPNRWGSSSRSGSSGARSNGARLPSWGSRGGPLPPSATLYSVANESVREEAHEGEGYESPEEFEHGLLGARAEEGEGEQQVPVLAAVWRQGLGLGVKEDEEEGKERSSLTGDQQSSEEPRVEDEGGDEQQWDDDNHRGDQHEDEELKGEAHQGEQHVEEEARGSVSKEKEEEKELFSMGNGIMGNDLRGEIYREVVDEEDLECDIPVAFRVSSKHDVDVPDTSTRTNSWLMSQAQMVAASFRLPEPPGMFTLPSLHQQGEEDPEEGPAAHASRVTVPGEGQTSPELDLSFRHAFIPGVVCVEEQKEAHASSPGAQGGEGQTALGRGNLGPPADLIGEPLPASRTFTIHRLSRLSRISTPSTPAPGTTNPWDTPTSDTTCHSLPTPRDMAIPEGVATADTTPVRLSSSGTASFSSSEPSSSTTTIGSISTTASSTPIQEGGLEATAGDDQVQMAGPIGPAIVGRVLRLNPWAPLPGPCMSTVGKQLVPPATGKPILRSVDSLRITRVTQAVPEETTMSRAGVLKS